MKKSMWTKITGSVLLSLTYILSASIAQAQCPVCTVAVIGGVGFSRWLKIDDTIAGLWVGGFLISLTVATINWLTKKKIKFFGRKPLVLFFYYFLTIAPLYWTKFIGHPMNKIFGVDKLVVGIIIGSIFFYIMAYWYSIIKQENGGHAWFAFQKVVWPISPLIILSAVFYFVLQK